MSQYLVEVSYTTEAFAALVKNPHDQIEQIAPVVARLGGRIETAHFAFGDYDLVMVIDMPDGVSAAAFSMAVAAGGAVRVFRTRLLLTVADSVQAMRKARHAEYQPPSYVADWE